jgi:hypothetical protein
MALQVEHICRLLLTCSFFFCPQRAQQPVFCLVNALPLLFYVFGPTIIDECVICAGSDY